MKRAMTTLVLAVFLALSTMILVPVSENAEAAEATPSSITMDLCPNGETFEEQTYNAMSQTTVKAQIIYTGTGNKEGHLINFSLQQRNSATGVYYYKMHRVIPTDDNGTAYWNINPYNMSYPAVASGSQEYSFNISTRGSSLPMGDSPLLKYDNQTFTIGATDNVTVLIQAPEYVAIGSLFRPYIQAFSHELRYDPAGANVSVDIRHWNYAGTNTTVQSVNTAFNNNSWVQPTFFLNDTHYNEGYYEIFVGLHNNTGAGYPHANYEGAPATGNWYYHRAWYGFRIVDELSVSAGSDQEKNIAVNTTLTGSASTGYLLDNDNTLNYTWTQTAGTTVTITNKYTAIPYFTTPTTPDLLVFRLNITDDYGQYGWDTVTVRVYDSKITLAAGWNLESNPTGAVVALSTICGKATAVTTATWRDDSTGIWYTYIKTAGVTDKNVPAQGGVFIYNSGTAVLTITL